MAITQTEKPGPTPAGLLVDQLYQAFRRRDLRALGELLDPQVQVTWNSQVFLTVWNGREEVLSKLARSIKDSGGTAMGTPISISADSDRTVWVVQQESGCWSRADHDRCASVTFDVTNGLITRVTRTPLVDDSDVVDGARPIQK